MLFVLIASHLIILAVANPFHKYPYVFLLDVGNEELQKTNSEQIRVSVPGGSLALRYPAVGDGDIIAHVRVSGIDFGTDLKANIIDGGPGYKYVVLVFMGNTGVPYDAVITVQTISKDTEYDGNIIKNQDGGNSKTDNSRIEDDDPNDSSEELDTDDQPEQKVKSEFTQASSSYYNYAQKEDMNSNDYNNDENDVNSEYKNVHEPHVNDKNQENDYDENTDDDDGNDDTIVSENNDVDETKYDLNRGTMQVENKIDSGADDKLYYDRYKLLRPYLYDGVRVYPQQAIQYIPEGDSRAGFFADSEDNEQNINDEEVNNDRINYRDSNNNNYDSDDNSAVAS